MTNSAISDKNYEHVLNVWKAFQMNTMKDHHALYLQALILLLACVFETFRIECLNFFELDRAHYLSTPGYICDAMLSFTDVNFQLISVIENYQFVERTISMIYKSYAEGNNKFLKS